MNFYLETSRLKLRELEQADAAFIFELLNTPRWIQFIGDRQIRTIIDAAAYIQKIKETVFTNYWVVMVKEQQQPIGVITFMKRDYLDHYDIGFAFLPAYFKQGYGYEAAQALLDKVKSDGTHTEIVATVLRENTSSIQLLEKLGLTFNKEIVVNNEPLLLYTTNSLVNPATS